jgi:BASS family bile acid:Na+ symporter
MTLLGGLLLALEGSMMLIVFTLGLNTTPHDGTYLFRRPLTLLRMLVSMNLIMPALVLVAVQAFDLHPAVKIALFTLAVSPMPPFLPARAFKAGGEVHYTVGLLVSSCVLAIVLVPGSFLVANALLGRSMPVDLLRVAQRVFVGVLAPLALGMSARQLLPTFARRLVKPVSLAGAVLLIGCAIPVLVGTAGPMLSLLGTGMLAAFILFAATGLLVGHRLAGSQPERRTVLALATASRHPGIAIALAQGAFPDQKLVAPAVIAYLLVTLLVTTPYLRWTRPQRSPVPVPISAAEPRAEHP